MASLGRVLQKVFGSSGGTTEFGEIGSDAAGSPTTTKDLDTIQSLSQYLLGLYAITNNANEPPRIEDFNSLFLLITSQLSYLFQSGIPEWIATENYYADKSLVIYSGSIYGAITGTDGSPNINLQPDSNPSDWGLLVSSDGAINKAISAELSGLTEKTSLVAADVFVAENSASSYSKIKVLYSTLFKAIQWGAAHSSSADYTIQDTDIYPKYLIVHGATTGLINRNLPALASNIGKRYPLFNIGNGLTYINSAEGSNILYKGNSLSKLIFYLAGDHATVLATSSGWVVEDYYAHIESGWYNRSDWTNVSIGFSNFVYDNQSDSTDLTGQHFTEATSNNTGIVLSDSAPSGNAGTLTVYFVTGTGIFTDGRQITFGDARTCDVNEGTTNKNDNNYITHNMGINISAIEKPKMIVNITASYTNCNYVDFFNSNGNSDNGVGEIDSNNLFISGGASGFGVVNESYAVEVYAGTDYYCNIITEFIA